ncbi:cyclic nucleotide-binding domain-containing protein [Magnetospirillum aberrantis]|uniref:Cyclic nucleotide-binding domain-containing protein n=1 Tax=Magnetospirillum aberrantis SpK TaxID=908842 RepID=A0A7C9QV23_9PROT|nr:cyclic nucleotide-binding domain-containing protein [Magnetospirillum aberrantis]NFV79976.1 cyclic nucleotide-binding domain-containing protein [Magnetospirillum aberrantis SpK]
MTGDNCGGDMEEIGRLHLKSGEHVFSQGDHGDAAYMVQSGCVSLSQNYDGRQIDVGRVGPGEIFGEMTLMDSDRHGVTATAAEDCELAVIPLRVFRHKLDTADCVIRAVMEMFVRNIRTSPRLFLRRPRSLRDHVRQMSSFSWNIRRFASRTGDTATAENMIKVLDRLDTVLDDLAEIAELTADQRHDLIADEELNGVQFEQVVGSEGRRKI